MSQISLYMNELTMGKLRDGSQREGLSISKYVARIVETYLAGDQDAWPVEYWDNVYGCLSDEDADAMTASVRDASALDDSADDDCDWFA